MQVRVDNDLHAYHKVLNLDEEYIVTEANKIAKKAWGY